MKPSAILGANSTNYGTTFTGAGGIQPWAQLPKYDTYKSKYGPNYKIAPNFHGISLTRASQFGTMAAGFGIAAGIFAVFFFGEVPKVRKDILSKLPVIGDNFIREVAPEDNPF
ncbi:hypothetical protein K461DRAFT_266117 [Myriangium duriaei CBS 260.36]|uniref:Cytochrome b-c1 complex subunit 10 n=1 Tax=Myriangium duriaei CBS 260.36 TaxID=1168546 RepID=A0A9P4J437_9PEZI|nr:hypothetical protein K461DRAFT_266117 [Myriangium duriaei CBS 260.36]